MNLEMCVTGNDCHGSGTRAILYPFCQVCEAMPTTKRVPKLLSCNRVKYLNFEKSRRSVLKLESLCGLMSLPKTVVLKTSSICRPSGRLSGWYHYLLLFLLLLNWGFWLICRPTWTTQIKNKSRKINQNQINADLPLGKAGGDEWKGLLAVWVDLIQVLKFLVVNTLSFLLLCDYFCCARSPRQKKKVLRCGSVGMCGWGGQCKVKLGEIRGVSKAQSNVEGSWSACNR